MACTQFASTNTTDLSYILEVDCGITPDTPALNILPTTGGGPTGNITTTISEVIRADRMTDDLVVTDSEIGGTTNYELSYAPYKPIIGSLLMDSTPDTVALTDQTLTIVAATGAVTGTGTTFLTDLKVGQFVRINSVTDTGSNGVFKVVSIADDTNMVVTPSTTNVDATAIDFTIDGTNYRNGTDAADNYTFAKRILNGATTSYFYYRGCQISSMSFNFETGSILNGAFDVMGLTEEATDTEIPGSSYINPPSYSLMNSVSSISSIDIGGVSASTEFSNLNLTVNNNITPAKAIGTLGAAALAPFTLEISADSTVYFEDTVLYNQYLQANAFYLDITLQDGDNNIIVISLPKAKFSELDVPVDGKDNFLFQNGSITALRDDVNNYMVQITMIDAL